MSIFFIHFVFELCVINEFRFQSGKSFHKWLCRNSLRWITWWVESLLCCTNYQTRKRRTSPIIRVINHLVGLEFRNGHIQIGYQQLGLHVYCGDTYRSLPGYSLKTYQAHCWVHSIVSDMKTLIEKFPVNPRSPLDATGVDMNLANQIGNNFILNSSNRVRSIQPRIISTGGDL